MKEARLRRIALIFAIALWALSFSPSTRADVIADYPNLKQYLFKEPDPHLRFGFGASPIRIMKSQAGVMFSIFQMHWVHGPLDWEILNAQYGTTIAGGPESKVDSFTFRTSPKYRINDTLSIGPLLGYEFVSFPDVQSKLRNASENKVTPDFEPFSSRGLIFGGMVSETLHQSGTTAFKINEVFYKQTYSTEGTSNGWTYFFQDNALNLDSTPLDAGPVFVVEFSFMY